MLAGVLGLMVLFSSVQPRVARNTDLLLAEIETAHHGLQSVTARFTQRKHLGLLEEPLVSYGRFAFKMPDRVLWQVESPEPITITIRGDRLDVWQISAEDREALSMTPLAKFLLPLQSIFRGSVRGLEKDFEIQAEAENGRIQLTLTPKTASWKNAYRSIRLDFERPIVFVARIVLEDTVGDRLEIVFSEIERNGTLPAELSHVPKPKTSTRSRGR